VEGDGGHGPDGLAARRVTHARDGSDGGDAVRVLAGHHRGHRRAVGEPGDVDACGVDAQLRFDLIEDRADEIDVVGADGGVPVHGRAVPVGRDGDEAGAISVRSETGDGGVQLGPCGVTVEVDDQGSRRGAVVAAGDLAEVPAVGTVALEVDLLGSRSDGG
jgi:hypothetical protein